MPLALGGGGDGRPYIRFKPSINCWELSSESGPYEFEWTAPAVIDVENIQLGWLLIGTGLREWQPWPGNVQTSRPDERDWKQGFTLSFYSKALFDDEPVRELSSSQTGVIEFVKALYNECEANFGSGQVPVVQITGSRAEKIGRGTTRIPTYEIVKWTERPADLQSTAAPSAAPPPAPAQSAPPKRAAVAAEADEF